MIRSVKDKSQMYRLYLAGAFGNMFQTWISLTTCLTEHKGTVSIRYRGDTGDNSRFTRYNVPSSLLINHVNQMVNYGAEVDRITFNESAPDERLLWQGEVHLTTQGLHVRYSLAKAKMRDAMMDTANNHHIFGLAAREFLQATLYPSSYSDLDAILELYPHSVVEISVYEMAIGHLRGRNAVVWEVRDY